MAQARAAESATHTDRCTVTRADPDSPGGWTEDAGDTAPGVVTVTADLPCRLRAPSAADRAATAGEHQWSLQDAIWRISADVTGIRMGDVVTFTSSAQGVALDGPWTVMSPMPGSHVSGQRWIVRRAG